MTREQALTKVVQQLWSWVQELDPDFEDEYDVTTYLASHDPGILAAMNEAALAAVAEA